MNENVIGGTFKNESHAQLLSRILVLVRRKTAWGEKLIFVFYQEELALDAQALSFDVFYKDFTPLESRSHETGGDICLFVFFFFFFLFFDLKIVI